MLALSRKKNEFVVFTLPNGDQIEVMVSDIRTNKVRLAIKAPDDVLINRSEVQLKIDEEKQLKIDEEQKQAA